MASVDSIDPGRPARPAGAFPNGDGSTAYPVAGQLVLGAGAAAAAAAGAAGAGGQGRARQGLISRAADRAGAGGGAGRQW